MAGGHVEFDEFPGPGRCDCRTVQLSYDVPFYDYPAHSARAYHWRTRRDGGRAGDRAMYPQVVPAEMHDNPAGESEVTTVIMLMHDIVRVRQPRGRRRARSEI